RERSVHWGARTLDLDLLACGDTVLDLQELTLPHPHMHERMFVLQPLCDIDPCWRHPMAGKTAAQLLDTLLDCGHTRLANGQPW
ncbi:MAG: 2-amino-4-hydroxy-6-hydroxymethyldihydropteridine diphosphokinase, partial [Mariprofundaceae bacterium]